MKLVENMPYDYFAKRTITLNDDTFSMRYKNLRMDYSEDFQYKEIAPDFKESYYGENGWSNMALFVWIFAICADFLIAAIGKLLNSKIIGILSSAVTIAGTIVAAIIFLLQFKKYKFVSFKKHTDDNNSYLIGIKLLPSSKKFIDEFKKRITEANKNP